MFMCVCKKNKREIEMRLGFVLRFFRKTIKSLKDKKIPKHKGTGECTKHGEQNLSLEFGGNLGF